MSKRPPSIIHVGFTNTGTTSLQLNFFSRRADIFYVGEPYNEFGGIFSHLRYMEDFKYDEGHVMRLCNEQIFTKGEGRPIVISDETLCDSPQLYFAPYVLPRDVIALRLFRLFQPAKIVFTIRKQQDYVASMYLNLKQNSAFLARMPVPPLSRWYRGMLSQLRCNYLQNINFYETISVYEQIFSRKNILVLPLERLIIDGPDQYLQELCDFMEIELSDDDIDSFAQPRNVRMSSVKNLAAELLADDRFFTFYSTLEQVLGRERMQKFLGEGERVVASLDEEDLTDLRERVGSGNRLLAEVFGLDLKRLGYEVAVAPVDEMSQKLAKAATSMPLVKRASANRTLQAIIDTQRRALDAERQAGAARVRELRVEHDALVARIRELDEAEQAARAAHASQITELKATLEVERQAAATRVRELEATLGAERVAFTARMRELETGSGVPGRQLISELGRRIGRRIGMLTGRSSTS